MGFVAKALLYTALALCANAGWAFDPAALRGALAGDMRKLVVHDAPRALPEGVRLTDIDGAEGRIEDYRGRWVLLNFWATWCPPCRAEMPKLQALHGARGGERFAVVTVAAGRNSPEGIRRFFRETGVTDLPTWMDPRAGLAPQMGVIGLPVTVLVDPEGREVARLIGEADWSAPEAHAALAAAIGD